MDARLAQTSSFDQFTLPIILTYRNGELVANLIRFTDELDGCNDSARFTEDDVAHALLRYYLAYRIISHFIILLFYIAI
jgi:hypothetical protein